MAELPTGVEFKKSPDVFVSVAKAYAEHNWNRPNLRYDFPEFGRMPTHPERNNMVSPLIYEMLRITAGGDADQPAHDPNHTAIRLAIVEQDGDKLRAVATCTIEAVMLGSGHSRLHVGPMEGLEEYITPFLARLRKDEWFVEAPDEAQPLPAPSSPPIPARKKGWKPAEWDAIFVWYDRVGRDVCADLFTLARLIHRPYGTVRTKHGQYINRKKT